jgi:transposase
MKLTTADIVLLKYLLFEQCLPHHEIAARFNVTTRTVRQWIRKYRVFGGPYTPRRVVQGRPRLLTDAQRDVGRSTYLVLVRPSLIAHK